MANVHRAYDINEDCYYVRVEGTDQLHRFQGRSAEKESYSKMRTLINIEQKTDPRSQLIDHAKAT